MADTPRATRLTDEQRSRVAENLGLVGLQVRRLLARGVLPSRLAELRDELFQEGCLGLLQAARTYDPGGGLTFATYALPRIHYAAWRAWCRYRRAVRVPERLDRTVETTPGGADPSRTGAYRRKPARGWRRPRRPSRNPDIPRVWCCPPAVMHTLAARHDPRRPPRAAVEEEGGGERSTLGDRLHTKLLGAVDDAVDRLRDSPYARRDRGALARRVADERLLVPDAEYQTSLREIARTTGSSYARVVACERQLVAEVRRGLTADGEFDVLSEAETGTPEGWAAPLDDAWRGRVQERLRQRLCDAFAAAPRAARAELLLSVVERGGVDVEALLRTHVAGLPDAACTELLAGLSGHGC